AVFGSPTRHARPLPAAPPRLHPGYRIWGPHHHLLPDARRLVYQDRRAAGRRPEVLPAPDPALPRADCWALSDRRHSVAAVQRAAGARSESVVPSIFWRLR